MCAHSWHYVARLLLHGFYLQPYKFSNYCILPSPHNQAIPEAMAASSSKFEEVLEERAEVAHEEEKKAEAIIGRNTASQYRKELA